MQLFTDEIRRNPYPIYAHFRQTMPLAPGPNGASIMVFDYESVKRILSDSALFSSAATPNGKGKPLDWMIFTDPPRHSKLRALVSKAFTPRMIAELEPRIRQLSAQLLDPLLARGEGDLAAEYSIPLPTMVIADMLGIPADDWPRFKRWSDGILVLSDTIDGTDEDAQNAGQVFRQVAAEMNDYLESALRQPPGQSNNLLARLAEAEVDGQRLNRAEILGFFQLLLLAGNETTTNLLNNAILCLTENPDQLTTLRQHMELLPRAIEETLRFRSPLQMAFRAVNADVEFHGQTIPAGKLLLPIIGSANRDPAAFPNPETFDITRDPNPHLAFGHGAHFCLGAPLSRLEARIALTDLLTKTRSLETALQQPWTPRRALHVHGPTSLPVRMTV